MKIFIGILAVLGPLCLLCIVLESSVPKETGILNKPADIALCDMDGKNRNYHFKYNDESFTAIYTAENWQIIDSYKIDVDSDMKIICQALIDVNPIHGCNMDSYRTAEDLAYEWKQHNIAYAILPDSDPQREHVKNVDLDPKDQGKSFSEFYKEWSEEELVPIPS